MNLDAYGGRFHGRCVRLSLPWLGLREWAARNPLRLHFDPLPGRPELEEPEPGDTLPAFAASRQLTRYGADGYLIETSHVQPISEAALWLLRLEERPAYLLRGVDRPAKKDGVVRVRVEEALGPVPISTTGTAQAFYGDAAGEVRELLSSVEPALSDGELEELEDAIAMYGLDGHLPAALDGIRAARDRQMQARAKKTTPEELRRRSPLYIRVGAAPEGGRSRDWQGNSEKGTSCFRARLEHGVYVVDAGGPAGPLTMFKELPREGREVYRATGKEVGIGGANEPVLSGVELTPLPPGTRLRITEEWQPVITLAYAVDALKGFVYPPHIWRPPEEIVVPEQGTWTEERAPAQSAAEVLEAALPLSHSAGSLHGEAHWGRVAVAGARLCEETPGVDRLVMLLFAICHDAGRLRDTQDEHHAYRGARLARDLLEGGPLVSEEQLETLLCAIERHDLGETSEDPTVGACWDADRLDLWRVGVRPDPKLLSTEAAVGLVEWGRELGQEQFTWEEIMQAYEGSMT